MSASRAPILLLVALLAGCVVGPPPDRGPAVQEAVDERLDPSLRLDAEPRDVLAELLADGTLDADEAVRLAVANNRALHAILDDLDIARARLWRATIPPNPTLEAEVQVVEKGGGDLLELVAAQSIIDLLLIPLRSDVQGERYAQVEAEVTAAVVDLATEVRAAYRGLQAQTELVGLFRAASEAMYLSYDAAQRLLDAGNIIELEVRQEQALYEDAKLALVEAETMARRHRENLNALMGLWGDDGTAWDIAPRLPEPEALGVTPAELETRVLEASLDLQARRHELVALGKDVDLERLEALLPTGTLGVTAEREAGETWSLGPLGAWSIPLFDVGQAATAEARARLRQAYERFTDLAIRLRRQARATYVECASAGDRSRYLLGVILPLRAEITQRTQQQYNAMQLGVFQLLQVRRREFDTARRYVETLRDHWIARAHLEALLIGRMARPRFGILDANASMSPAIAGTGQTGGH